MRMPLRPVSQTGVLVPSSRNTASPPKVLLQALENDRQERLGVQAASKGLIHTMGCKEASEGGSRGPSTYNEQLCFE